MIKKKFTFSFLFFFFVRWMSGCLYLEVVMFHFYDGPLDTWLDWNILNIVRYWIIKREVKVCLTQILMNILAFQFYWPLWFSCIQIGLHMKVLRWNKLTVKTLVWKPISPWDAMQSMNNDTDNNSVKHNQLNDEWWIIYAKHGSLSDRTVVNVWWRPSSWRWNHDTIYQLQKIIVTLSNKN